MRTRWPLALCALLCACAGRVAPGPETLPPAEIYDLRLDVAVDSALTPAVPAVDAALPAHFAYTLELVVGVMDARRFRDDSLGRLVWIDQASLDGAPWGLAGRSAELRGFIDGEILAIDGWSHLAGPGRDGESLEILFGLLSPHIPPLDEGDHAPSASTFAVEVDPFRGQREQIALNWTHAGTEPESWRFSYEGDWRGRGRGGPVERSGVLRFEGEAKGELRVARADHALLEHRAAWTREVHLIFDEAPGGPAELVQRQSFQAELHRRPGPDAAIEARMRLPAAQRVALAQASIDAPVDADGRSLGRYLSAEAAQRALAEQLGPASACLQTGLGAAHLSIALEVASDGQVSHATVADHPGVFVDCLADALATVRLPAHDEDAARVEADLAWVGGALVVESPVRIAPRDLPFAFALLPPATAAEASRALRSCLLTPVPEQGSSVQGSDPTGDREDGPVRSTEAHP